MTERLDCPKCKAPLEAHEVVDGVVVQHCPSCFGVLYGGDDLAVPLDLKGLHDAKAQCPRCARAFQTGTAYDGAIEVDRCPTCAAVWFDAGEIQILRKLSGVENVAGHPGAEPEPEPKPKQEPKAPAQAPAAVKKTSDEPMSKSPVPVEMTSIRNPDAANCPTAAWNGLVYQHFQTSRPVTTQVLGEFPWIAQVGDTVTMRDFISPPYILSEEKADKETTWSAGEYVEPEEVWAAFKLPGNPPPKRGVGAVQPNPWSGRIGGMWTAFGLAAAACFGAYTLLAVTSPELKVYEGTFQVNAAEPERSRVSETFEIPGRTSNLDVTIDTNLDGHWAYVAMTLIDEEGRALDFGREVSYYHGFEDGESWSEGSSYERFVVPSVPPGRYYLRVEPETDMSPLNLRVNIKRGSPLLRLPVIALIFLLVPALWAAIRQDSFESERWMESDHPRYSGGDDGDDE